MAIEEGRGRSVQIPNDVNVLEIIQVTVFQNQSSIGKRLFTGQFTFSNNISMHNIHNYDNSNSKSNSLMFNYYVFKEKKF